MPELRRLVRATALAGAALGALGCGRAEAPARPWNLLVVLVDTLRADRLSLYGYERETSPELDRFARERGIVFRRSWANAGCTFPSVSSILTGRWPQRFLDRKRQFGMAIPPDMPTLAERLSARGYATAAVSASTIVRATPSVVNRQGGFGAGFGSFDESCEKLGAACVNERALASLDGLAEPFFLYLHYLDPHQPYRPPREHDAQWAERRVAGAQRWVVGGNPAPIYRRLYDGETSIELDRADLRRLSDLYDEEIRFFDHRFGELRVELERRGLVERTVVVLLSDHGEELYDHEQWGHCRDLAFDTVLSTPLVFWVPGLGAGERRTLVSNLDVVPTLLDLLGVDVAPGELDGESLRALLEGRDPDDARRLAFATQGRSRTARDQSRQLLLDLGTGRSTFWREVPGRARLERLERDPADAESLRASLEAWLRSEEKGVDATTAVREADENERELRALGYL